MPFKDAGDREIAENDYAEWQAMYQEWYESSSQDERDEQDRLLASVFIRDTEIESQEKPF